MDNIAPISDATKNGIDSHSERASSHLLADTQPRADEALAPLQKDLRLPQTDAAKAKFALRNTYMDAPPAIDCDRRPQGPALTRQPIFDTCGIELSKLYAQSKDSIAQAVVPQPDKTTNWGTTFKICNADTQKCGYVTNDHVAQDADQIGIVSTDGKTVKYASIVGRDPRNDLVVTDLPAGDERPALKISQSKTGDPAFTIGHPGGVPWNVVSAGQITGLNVTGTNHRGQEVNDMIESTLLTNNGNSGGPQLDASGAATGIIARAGIDKSRSIPIQRALDLLQ